MKTITRYLVNLSLIVSVGQQVQAQDYSSSIEKILQLESSGNLKSAVIYSATLSLNVGQAIGVGQVVESSQLKLAEIRKQIVKTTVDRKWEGSSASQYGGSYDKGNSTINYTQIISVNPEDVSQFGEKIQSQQKELNKKLLRYVKDKEESLLLAKIAAAKALQLFIRLNHDERNETSALVANAANQIKQFSFLGNLAVQRCLITNYASYTDHVQAFSVFVSAGENSSQSASDNDTTTTHRSYTEKSCELEKFFTSITGNEIHLARLSLADAMISFYEKQAVLIEFSDPYMPYSPTWGNPAYK